MPRTNVSEAAIVDERIRCDVREKLPDVTVSIGLSDTSDGVHDPVTLSGNADTASYCGKARGRNIVTTFAPASSERPAIIAS